MEGEWSLDLKVKPSFWIHKPQNFGWGIEQQILQNHESRVLAPPQLQGELAKLSGKITKNTSVVTKVGTYNRLRQT